MKPGLRGNCRRLAAVSAALAAALGPATLTAADEPAAVPDAAPTVVVGDATTIVTEVCSACHGQDGNSLVPIFPKLAGQQRVYTAKQLDDYFSGKRENAVMAAAIARIRRSDVPGLAAYFSTQAPAAQAAAADDPAVAERGRRLYETGDLATGIAACAACHEPQAGGDGRYPRLAGQSAAYAAQTLNEFKAGTRKNDTGRVMRNIAAPLSDADIQALAAYLASR